MNKTLILSCIFLLVLSSFAIAVDTGNLTETNENITLYFDNTGTLTKNYPGFFNVTWNSSQGWAKVNNGSVIVTYNVSSGESWALYQDPTTCVMPYNDYSPTDNQQGNICYGAYGLHDEDADNIINYGNNMILNCNGALFFGNQTTNSRAIGGNVKINATIKNCNIRGYARGINIQNTNNSFIYNNSISNSPLGINFVNLVINNILLSNTISNSTNRAISTSGYNSYNNLTSNTISNSVTILYLDDNSTNTIIDRNYFFNNTNGLDVRFSNYSKIINNQFFNTTLFSIRFKDTANSIIDNNTLVMIHNTNSSHPQCIYFYTILSTNNFNNITNNIIRGCAYGIYLDNSTTNSYVYNNSVNNTYLGIKLDVLANNNQVVKNSVTFSDWDAIQYYSWNNIISDNFISDYAHNAIDSHLGTLNNTISGNTSIFNNYITQSTSNIYWGTSTNPCAGMYIQKSANNSIYNNTLTNLNKSVLSSDCTSRGISIEGGNLSYNNRVYNNNLINISRNCLQDTSNNTIWTNNRLTNCEWEAWIGSNFYFKSPVSSIMINNSASSGLFRVNLSTQSASINNTLTFSNSPLNTNLNFYESYQSNLFSFLTINALTPPYNDIRINGVVSALNQPNYSITLNPGDLVEVSDFTYCGDGIVQSPNDNSSFMEDCDGANLNSQTCLSVGFTKGTLSCNSCSFVTTDCQAKSQLCQDNLVPLSGMTTWLGLLVTIICIAFVFIIFTDNSINIKMEGNTFYTTVLIIISVGFLIGVGILILSNLC